MKYSYILVRQDVNNNLARLCGKVFDMIIKDLTISNLFSFEKSEINLGKYNVITGYNGAGKSNLVRLFKLIILDRDYGILT
jgi:ABC-type proline/glycine betaine transport system ATPase subunit